MCGHDLHCCGDPRTTDTPWVSLSNSCWAESHLWVQGSGYSPQHTVLCACCGDWPGIPPHLCSGASLATQPICPPHPWSLSPHSECCLYLAPGHCHSSPPARSSRRPHVAGPHAFSFQQRLSKAVSQDGAQLHEQH